MLLSQLYPTNKNLHFKSPTKGYLISKGFFVSLFGPKNQRNFLRISALASKKRMDQKNKGTICILLSPTV